MPELYFQNESLYQSLQWPFREVYGTAILDYEPQGINQLKLRAGCQVLIIGKNGDGRGWWRGKVGDVVCITKDREFLILY